jgi:mannose-6-phosphate isomerase-like protein (cupin superfamily)
MVALAAPTAASGEAQTSVVIDQGNAEHYQWGGANDGWHLVKRDDLSVIRERMVPGGMEVPHRHVNARQYFQVLGGTLILRTDAGLLTVKAGQGVEIAPGLLHQAINRTSEPIDFIVISMPPSHRDRVEGSFADK